MSSSECYPMANVHEGTKDKTAFIAATLCDSEQLMSRRAEKKMFASSAILSRDFIKIG